MGTTSASQGVLRRVAARVGLVGNPSDGFGGAVLSTIVPGLHAEVTASTSADVVIAGDDVADRWPSASAWRDDLERNGIHGAQRIIHASMWTLVAHLRRTHPEVVDTSGATVSWRTNIPMSVGLAGSSALAVATIDAVAACWGITLDRRVCAALALSAERDVLGIAAGWQDRIVQAFDRTVLVDAAAMDEVDGVSVPRVYIVDSPGDAPGDERPRLHLVVGWHAESMSSSHDYHAPLQRDLHAVAGPMAELAALARSAAISLERGDVAACAAALDAGWRTRQLCVPLRPDHTAIVESVRATGVPATTPGSGGSVVAICADADAVDRARGALAAGGCDCIDFVIR